MRPFEGAVLRNDQRGRLAQLSRVVRTLEERGEWDDTPACVTTADHGEQLGDHGLKEKLGFFPQSYHIIGLWRDPHSGNAGRVVTRFTENVDLLPTLADVLSLDEPAQCDGRSLTPLMAGLDVAWRSAAHYEWDYRAYFIRHVTGSWPKDRSLSLANLAASVSGDLGYVQFADGTIQVLRPHAPTGRGVLNVATPSGSCTERRNSWSGDKNICAAT